MLFVAETNFIPLLIALLIGLIAAYWAFHGRRSRSRDTAEDIQRAQETPRS
jgi:hypothetical protein